jgi:hypothetical protein
MAQPFPNSTDYRPSYGHSANAGLKLLISGKYLAGQNHRRRCYEGGKQEIAHGKGPNLRHCRIVAGNHTLYS